MNFKELLCRVLGHKEPPTVTSRVVGAFIHSQERCARCDTVLRHRELLAVVVTSDWQPIAQPPLMEGWYQVRYRAVPSAGIYWRYYDLIENVWLGREDAMGVVAHDFNPPTFIEGLMAPSELAPLYTVTWRGVL